MPHGKWQANPAKFLQDDQLFGRYTRRHQVVRTGRLAGGTARHLPTTGMGNATVPFGLSAPKSRETRLRHEIPDAGQGRNRLKGKPSNWRMKEIITDTCTWTVTGIAGIPGHHC